MCVTIGARIWNPHGVLWLWFFSPPGGPFGATGGYQHGTPPGFDKKRRGRKFAVKHQRLPPSGRGGQGRDINPVGVAYW